MSLNFSLQLFYCFIFFCEVRESVLAYYPQVFHDKIITKGIFSVRTHVDWLGCIQDCLASTDCISYNFKMETSSRNNSCELSSCAVMTQGGCAKDKLLRYSRGYIYQQLKQTTKEWKDCDAIAPPTVAPTAPIRYKDCADALRYGHDTSGVYTIDPDGKGVFSVQCDQTTDGGGWTIVQQRVDKSQNFYLTWRDYAVGFGTLDREYWLGLDRIHRLTLAGNNVLRVEMATTVGANSAFAEYSNFTVSSESTLYKLNAHYIRGVHTGDSLTSYHVGRPFSTKDSDNDQCAPPCSCAQRFKGAWWYDGKNEACLLSDLNSEKTMLWSTYGFTIAQTYMKIRRANT